MTFAVRAVACARGAKWLPTSWGAHCLVPRNLQATWSCKRLLRTRHAFSAKIDSTGAQQPFEVLEISALSLRAVNEIFRYHEMTEVQTKVLPELLSRKFESRDAVVHARTGTGKTLTYLIPILEEILHRPTRGVSALIVAPTRELVLQITRETDILCTYHAIQVVPLIGGVRRDQDELIIRRRRPGIIVGTPGRIVEHLETTFRFQTLFDALGTLVLDECDHMLENQVDLLKELLAYLPQGRYRQWFFSATVPPPMLDLAARFSRSTYKLFDCVGKGTATQPTVELQYVVCPGMLMLTVLRNIVAEEMRENPAKHKVIVFFPTARLAAFVSQLFRERLKMRVYELHARLEGVNRIVTQDEYGRCSCGILFTAGTSERGMDYQGVTLVVQLFAPLSREQFVHRVGRTARVGQYGRAVLVLLDRETNFMKQILDLPVKRHPLEAMLLQDTGETLMEATSSAHWGGTLHRSATAAYISLLRHYRLRQEAVLLDQDDTIDAVLEFFMGCGLVEVPSVSHQLAAELGFEASQRLRIEGSDERGSMVLPSTRKKHIGGQRRRHSKSSFHGSRRPHRHDRGGTNFNQPRVSPNTHKPF